MLAAVQGHGWLLLEAVWAVSHSYIKPIDNRFASAISALQIQTINSKVKLYNKSYTIHVTLDKVRYQNVKQNTEIGST